MSTQEINNYRKVSELLSLGGQPTEEQIKSAAREWFRTIINLATINSRSSLPDEGGLVRSLGMIYYHIPVEWGNPTEYDFESFENVFRQLSKEKMLIHCAANFRATAFYMLYALKHLGWSDAQADEFMASVWEGSHYPVWENFINQMKRTMKRDAV
jgi:protein tyrosine phosphatase (PTP) superfamily phosphohydrolase (DUF442 family)